MAGVRDPLAGPLWLAARSTHAGNFLKALQVLNQILATQPDQFEALVLRGEVYYRTRKLRLARRDLEKAEKLAPDHGSVQVYLGLVTSQEGDIRRSERHFARAVESLPSDVSVLWLHADSLYRLGRFEEAAPTFRRLIELQPREASLWCDLAYCHYHDGDLPAALDAFTQAVQLAPEHIELLLDTARLTWRMGLPDFALRHLRHAERAGPTDPRVLTVRACFEAHAGNRAKARDLARRALALDPENEGARRLKELLGDRSARGTGRRRRTSKTRVEAYPRRIALPLPGE